jgi:hypothetical protein
LFQGYRPTKDVVQYIWNGTNWVQSQSFGLTSEIGNFTADIWYATVRMSYDGSVVVAGATSDTYVSGVGENTWLNVWRNGVQHILNVPPDPLEVNFTWSVGVSGDGNRIFAEMRPATFELEGQTPPGIYRLYSNYYDNGIWTKYCAIRWWEWDGGTYQPKGIFYVPKSFADGNKNIIATPAGVGNISCNYDGTIIAVSNMGAYYLQEWFDGTNWRRAGPTYMGAVTVWKQAGDGSWNFNYVFSPFAKYQYTVGGNSSEEMGYTATLDRKGTTLVCGFQYGKKTCVFEGDPPITLSKMLLDDHFQLDAVQKFKIYPYPIFLDGGDPGIATVSHDGNRIFVLEENYPDSDAWNYSTPVIFCYERC